MSFHGAFICTLYHVIGLKPTCGIKKVTLKVAKKIASVVVYWEEKYNFPKTKDFQQIEQLDLHRSVVPWKREKLAKNK